MNSPDFGAPLLFHPSEGVTFTMPEDGVITFYPEIFVPTDQDNFENRTKLVLEPAVGFDTARAGLSVDLGPISIGDDVCLGCERWATPVDFDVYHDQFKLGNGGAFARVALPPVTMIGDNTNVPELVSASRESLPVWFYDQLRVDDPNSNVQSQFDDFVGGSTALVLFGRRFREPGPCVTLSTKFWIHGQEQALDTTWIDANTLRVEFPNRLRLIPGLGRFWVETTAFDADGMPVPSSNTLDFLITYPRPNIIKAGPTLCAADPDFRDVLMRVAAQRRPFSNGAAARAGRGWSHAPLRPAPLRVSTTEADLKLGEVGHVDVGILVRIRRQAEMPDRVRSPRPLQAEEEHRHVGVVHVAVAVHVAARRRAGEARFDLVPQLRPRAVVVQRPHAHALKPVVDRQVELQSGAFGIVEPDLVPR